MARSIRRQRVNVAAVGKAVLVAVGAESLSKTRTRPSTYVGGSVTARNDNDLDNGQVVSSPNPSPNGPKTTDPALAEIVAAWRTLPEPIRAGIAAMVRAIGTSD